MNYSDIVTYVTDKIGETDQDSKDKCLSFAKARHRLVYDSFDWTAAQDTLTLQVTINADNNGLDVVPSDSPGVVPPQPPVVPPPGQGGGSVDIAVDAEKIMSARFNGVFLDPVSASYIFESHPEMFLASGTPQFYWTRYESDALTTSVRLFPAPDNNGTLELLIKRKFDDSANQLLIPNIEDVVITFVLADMWENLRQMGIYAQKLTEAQALLTAAQGRDVPSTPKPRTSKNLTASGETLAELVDSVCDVVGKWEPDLRESVRDRIRRNYTQLWDTYMLPESLVIANVPIDVGQEQVILPSFFDRVIEVRTNNGGPLTRATSLKQAEISYYFNINKDIFEQSGEPFGYTMLSSVGVEVLPPFNEELMIASNSGDSGGRLTRHPQPSADSGKLVFVKGESHGTEFSESMALPIGGQVPGPVFLDDPNQFTTSLYSYDTPLTVSKVETDGTVSVYGAKSHVLLLTLAPKEREKKCLRIWLLPNENPQQTGSVTATPGSVLVLGKRRVSALLDDLDSPQIRNISNILINAAAADIFDRLGNDAMATKYATKAAAQVQILTDAETKQNAYQPVITPYVSGDCDDLGWADSGNRLGW